MIRLKAVYLSDSEINDLMFSVRALGMNSLYFKLKKTLESKEYSNIFEA